MGKGDDPNRACAAPMQAVALSGDAQRALRDPGAARDLVLSRDDFREAVFERDRHRCVICGRGQLALDAHHIMDRALFADTDPRPGGYVLANGVSVCSESHPDGTASCHLQAEQTLITPEQLRQAAGIQDVVLPDHLETAPRYTKWGDEVTSSGLILPGEMFHREAVQKTLSQAGVLDRYARSIKHPRTFHLPWSPGATDDDKVMADTSYFEGKEVVVTEKLDGELWTMTSEVAHARSLDSKHHPSRDWAKVKWSSIRYDIPTGWRITTENLTAQHHVAYDRLPGYLIVHVIWNEKNQALSWDEIREWSELLDLPVAPEAWRGTYDQEKVRGLFPFQSAFGDSTAEGYVMRTAEGFAYRDFRRAVGKFVAREFREALQSSEAHWMQAEMVRNRLKD